MDPEDNTAILIGNMTETALLKFVKMLGWANYKFTQDAMKVIT